jgi:hypothetical protein
MEPRVLRVAWVAVAAPQVAVSPAPVEPAPTQVTELQELFPPVIVVGVAAVVVVWVALSPKSFEHAMIQRWSSEAHLR